MPFPFSMPSRVPPMPPQRPMPKPPEKPPAPAPAQRGLFKGSGDAPSWSDLKYRIRESEYYERSKLKNWSGLPVGDKRAEIIEEIGKLDTEGGGYISKDNIGRVFSKIEKKIAASSGNEKEEWKRRRDLFKKWTED